jgi:phospholipid transport system substrate-binding protein
MNTTSTAFVVSATMLMVLAGNDAVHAAPTPTETVTNAIVKVMHILNDPLFMEAGMSEARRGEIENVVRASISYEEMARRSLGITWRDLNESDRQEFVHLFIRVLRDAVACRMHDYSTAQVVYLSEQREGNFAEVRTLFNGAKVDTSIDVRLVNRSGDWLMYDAVIDGVSLVRNYQAQFVQVIRDASYAGLVDRIEAKTLLQKRFERTHTLIRD